MKRGDVRELCYICPIENLPSILRSGLLSHKRAERLLHRSVAMQVIQDRRTNVIIPGAKPLHEYVNLYINARNKMMYKLVCNIEVGTICVIRVSDSVLELPGVIISDRNASSGYARFEPAPKGLANIDKDQVFAQSWKHPDDFMEEKRHGSIVCAEVLVPNRLATMYITGVYVVDDAAARLVASTAPGMLVTIDADVFFR